MIITNQFSIGETVYLRTDTDQLPWLITGLRVKINGMLLYDLSAGTHDTVHYELELSRQRDVVLATSN